MAIKGMNISILRAKNHARDYHQPGSDPAKRLRAAFHQYAWPYALSSSAGTPRYRGSWANDVSFGPATITGTLYYTSGLSLTAPDQGDGCLSTHAAGDNLPASCRMASFTTFDLTCSYDITDHVAITVLILNAFNRKAPFDPFNYAALNYNPTWAQAGAVGRFYTVGVKVKM